MKPKVFLAALAFCSTLAFALPSSQDVQGAVNSGDYARAEQMMQEVVGARPQSAKAHYVYAEILAHQAKFDEAARQAQEAQRIDPSLGFTDPQRFRSFEQLLARERSPGRAGDRSGLAPAGTVPHASGLPGWAWGLGLALVAFLVWRMVSRRAAAGAMPAPAYGGGYRGGPAAGYGPGYGPGAGYGYGPGATPGGSALRTGLAAAGGLAGGMLLEKYLEGQHGDGYHDGGAAPGWVDDGSAGAAQELEQRPIDFGQGNDWGGDLGPSADFSPSGDDGGGW